MPSAWTEDLGVTSTVWMIALRWERQVSQFSWSGSTVDVGAPSAGVCNLRVETSPGFVGRYVTWELGGRGGGVELAPWMARAR